MRENIGNIKEGSFFVLNDGEDYIKILLYYDKKIKNIFNIQD